jgi:thiol:disulfide interchange protein DsbA
MFGRFMFDVQTQALARRLEAFCLEIRANAGVSPRGLYGVVCCPAREPFAPAAAKHAVMRENKELRHPKTFIFDEIIMSHHLHPMKKFGLAFLALFAFATTTAHAQQGVTPLNPPQPVEGDGKVEVLEFFAYGCGHCANLEPSLEAWVKKLPADVKFTRVPSPARLMGIDSTVLYYSLEALGQLERLHGKIFIAAHRDKVILGSPAILNEWLEKNSVDPKKYEEVQKSFSVSSKVMRARKMMEDYKISSTPMFIVNGRFQVLEQATGGPAGLFANIDQLIVNARGATKPAAKPSGK